MSHIKQSLNSINWKLYIALLVMGLVPAIYTTVRIFFLGQFPGDYSYSIAGQLAWINLVYEVINEAIILPLFYFMGQTKDNRNAFSNCLKTGLLVSFGIYLICAIIIIIFAEPLLNLMAVSPSIISESATYIRIESIANIFGILFSFASVSLITLGHDKLIYILTSIKLGLCLIFDTLLVSNLGISLKLGVNGIGISNICVNLLLFIVTIVLISKCGYSIFNGLKMSFTWMKDFFTIGGISGLESFVRNLAYMLMVSRMVNIVGEQGTYWVANSFIWGWLLLPVIQLGELIKQETANNKNAIKNNSVGYFTVTGIICLLWCALIPTYKPFMQYAMGYNDVDKLFELVMVLLGFYMLFAIQNVADSTFYGRGKTKYMLLGAVITNIIYYGTFFVLYLTETWVPTLLGIALMFGCGNAFDTVVSLLCYRHFLKKEKINIFR